MTRAILLDFDDTILATTATRRPILDAALLQRGATSADIAGMHARWGNPLRQLIGPLVTDEEYPAFVSSLLPLLGTAPPEACPGAESFLRAARRAELPVVIVTSSESPFVLRDLKALGFDECVDRVFGSDMTSFHKPDGRVFEEAGVFLRERFNIDIADGVYIGDSRSDHRATLGVCAFEAVLTGSTSAEEFIAAGVASASIHHTLGELEKSLWA